MEYGLIGKKLTHSFSKTIHNMLYNASYELIELNESELDVFFSKKEFKAINVTIPYKSAVIKYLDEISPIAKKIGAVNTIVNKGGRLYGYNTDFYGMRDLLIKNGISPKGKKCAVLGTGGTSKTAHEVLSSFGAETVLFISRTKKNGCVDYETFKSKHNDTEIIINTTPCGMYPDTFSAPIDLEGFNKLIGVLDVVYNPLRTNLVIQAQNFKIKAAGGLYMLVSQAIYAAELFIDKNFEKTVFDDIYKRILKSKQNIVLCGMAGCGKTTIGKIISEKLNMDFYDSDELVEKNEKRKISEIFSKDGESYFRNSESEVIKTLSEKNGSVISVGGGAVMFEKNVLNLKKNGILIFYERPINDILPTADRPLSSDRTTLVKLYEKRYPIYKDVSDLYVICDKSADIGAQSVIERYFNECDF